MNANAYEGSLPTPREVARSITRAWIGYFIVVTVVGAVLSLLVGGIYQFVANAVGGSPMLVRLAIMAVGILINAPVSFLVFHWAVRGKVVPSILDVRSGSTVEAG